MEPSHRIRLAVAEVVELRRQCSGAPDLQAAVREVKRFQSLRFAGTYADLLVDSAFAPAARFFLEELYGDNDFTDRDAQFSRIAGALERLFPADVVETAVALAELHALTERLDLAMAASWRSHPHRDGGSPARYICAWQEVSRRSEREQQLTDVLAIGAELARLTRMPGLRVMLKMMRGPASAAGLGSLQRFLEQGFDTFATMARRSAGARDFLDTVRSREQALIHLLFDGGSVACETELVRLLGKAR